ncbi:MAG: phosphatidate cytidylyltransferase [Candidatus Cyclonatronum sp.]|uniref:phosphatidate cytidylyltransferase n=1 Tax=Cyclonatronum sp. TaxID=3024185 RepID=UPI0025C05C5B|nr:phosphatidate cytidylyltransferase [Cyclonatronum sp.]MCC5934141.1 phosphatidate cytidylyltransferase [Balneolales bacterium]MCH8486258.1 phosphatidate cytidylyltransferase [Cyclonatronum sp.]
MSELTKRIILALVAAPLFMGVVWLGGWSFKAMMIAIAIIIQWEMAGMFNEGGTRPSRPFMYAIGLWVMLIPYVPNAYLAGLALFLLLILSEIVRGPDRSYSSLVHTIFCGLYAPLGIMTLLLLRDRIFPEEPVAGFVITASVVMMVWGNDVFAYFTGKNFGKHLLAPKISPKKTWEGFAGGFVGALAGVAFVFALAKPEFISFVLMIPAVILVSVFGPVGDLAASKLKRMYDTKDSSNILPGHGGFFDRFDALLLAAPAVFFYLEILRISGII